RNRRPAAASLYGLRPPARRARCCRAVGACLCTQRRSRTVAQPAHDAATKARMWIVKLGGSLGRDPVLKEWLATVVKLGSGRVVIVPGGGGFADEVREQQDLWRFDDLAAHNMAVLAMAQMALMMKGICPALTLAASDSELRQAVQQARVPVWLPFE